MRIYITSTLAIFIVLASFLGSCKQDTATSSNTEVVSSENGDIARKQKNMEAAAAEKLKASGKPVTEEAIQDMLGGSKKSENNIPDACTLLNEKEVSKAFGVYEADVIESNGKRRQEGNDNSKSCFWRWSGGGVLVQLSQNPLPDEVGDWCSRYINTKKSTGENSIDDAGTSKRFAYIDFDGPGTFNIYNKEMARYYSTLDEKYIVTLIFNGNMTAKKQMGIAKQLMNSIFTDLK